MNTLKHSTIPLEGVRELEVIESLSKQTTMHSSTMRISMSTSHKVNENSDNAVP